MTIGFMDLQTQYQGMAEAVRTRIDAVLNHGRYIMGPEIAELEQRLAEYVGVKHAIGCSSGTDALLMPLMAYGVGPGDAVFTTPFTFFATAEAIALTGATPVFVDIEPRSYNIDPGQLERAIQQIKNAGQLRPRGIIAVDLFGLAADYDAVMDIAQRNDLFVIEDAAQSIGGRYKGRMVGSMGHVAATSFYPAKPLGCYGDGGAIFTDDDELARLMRSIRVHGEGKDKYNNVRLGINGRLDSIQAAILLVKLDHFEDELTARNRVAQQYDNLLQGVVKPTLPDTDNRCAWALYTIQCGARDQLQTRLREAGIPTVIYYPLSLHLQTAFAYLGHKAGDFPNSEAAQARVLSLPMHPFLSEAEIIQVADAVSACA